MEQLHLFGAAQENIEKSLLADLLEQSRVYRQSKDYLELLDFVTRLPNFAPFNAFLLRLQKPGPRFASSAYDWRRKFNRTIKEGARPLIILWPFGPIALVYEVDDTEGDPLPESVLNAFHATGEITEAKINRFSLLLDKVGIDLKLIEYGDAHAGHVSAAREPEGLTVQKRSTDAKVKPDYHVRVNSTHEPNVQFVTLLHELGHLYLGHLGPDKFLNISKRPRLSRAQEELEAESLAYLVCKRNDVESKSEEYLSSYVQANTTVEHLDLYFLLKAAGQIETILQLGEMVSFGPRKKTKKNPKKITTPS